MALGLFLAAKISPRVGPKYDHFCKTKMVLGPKLSCNKLMVLGPHFGRTKLGMVNIKEY